MEALTPAERRGALLVVLLLALGAGHDLWRASRPLPAGPAGAGVPPAAAPSPAGDAAPAPRSADGPAGPVVDLNLAGARELETLPGVGPVLAARIVAHRARVGAFRHPEELRAVRGIGPRLLERLRPRVRVGPGAPAGTVSAGPGR